VAKEETIESLMEAIHEEERRLGPFRKAMEEARQREEAREALEARCIERAKEANRLLNSSSST
jgi:hypothetical protein